MTIDQMIREMSEGWSIDSRYQAVDQLRWHLNDPTVLRAMCSAALKEINAPLREHIVTALHPVRHEANRLFEKAAAECACAAIRERAFISLSLLGCRTARSTVIQGLNDADHDVRMAAALNMGQYNDLGFASAVESFLEKNRFGLLKKSMDEFFAGLLEKAEIKNKSTYSVGQPNPQNAVYV